MRNESPFALIAEDMRPIFEELHEREPIFHRAAFGATVENFARTMAPDYWEVGASGRQYPGPIGPVRLTSSPAR